MSFEPNYLNLLQVLNNQRPDRLPLYEHPIDAPFISKVLGETISSQGLKNHELEDYYRKVIGFWKEMTYDGFDFEAAICDILPGHGAIMGGMAGPIQTREDFNNYPWDDIPTIFWETYTPHFEAIRKTLPAGMKAYGGCGYGIFEASQDLGAVHAGLDDFERHDPFHRLRLLGHPDRTHAAFADLLQQFVRADARAGNFAGWR